MKQNQLNIIVDCIVEQQEQGQIHPKMMAKLKGLKVDVREKPDERIFNLKVIPHKQEGNARKIADLLEENCRYSLTKIADKSGTKLSTAFKLLEKIKRLYDFKLVMVKRKKDVTATNKVEGKARIIIQQLETDPRMKLTTMSKRTKIPVSTLWEVLSLLKEAYHLKMKLVPKEGK